MRVILLLETNAAKAARLKQLAQVEAVCLEAARLNQLALDELSRMEAEKAKQDVKVKRQEALRKEEARVRLDSPYVIAPVATGGVQTIPRHELSLDTVINSGGYAIVHLASLYRTRDHQGASSWSRLC